MNDILHKCYMNATCSTFKSIAMFILFVAIAVGAMIGLVLLSDTELGKTVITILMGGSITLLVVGLAIMIFKDIRSDHQDRIDGINNGEDEDIPIVWYRVYIKDLPKQLRMTVQLDLLVSQNTTAIEFGYFQITKEAYNLLDKDLQEHFAELAPGEVTDE